RTLRATPNSHMRAWVWSPGSASRLRQITSRVSASRSAASSGESTRRRKYASSPGVLSSTTMCACSLRSSRKSIDAFRAGEGEAVEEGVAGVVGGEIDVLREDDLGHRLSCCSPQVLVHHVADGVVLSDRRGVWDVQGRQHPVARALPPRV